MFLENKYTKTYMKIVYHAKNRSKNDGVFYERHHIIPKSMGGNNSKENIILLKPKEHYVVHHLLTKMCEGVNSTKMNYAFWKMNIRYKKEGCISINFTTYEKIRQKQQQNMSKTMTGRFVSEQAKEAVRKSNSLRVGEKHPLFGTKRPENVIEASRKANLGNKYCVGRIFSDETKKKMSEKQKARQKYECEFCKRIISGIMNYDRHLHTHKTSSGNKEW